MHLSIFSAAILCIAGSSVDATPVKRGMRRIARPIHFTHLGPSAPPQPGVATNSTTKVFNMRGCRRSQRRIAEQLERSRLLPLGGKQAVVAQASTGVEVLTDDYSNGTDNDYYGNLLVGTPAQQTTVDFDTGSSDLVLPLGVCLGNCTGPLFYSLKSSTFRTIGKPYTITYDDNSGADGIVAYDTVSVAGLSVKNQGFGAILRERGDFSGPFAGMIGLGFPGNAYAGNPWFFNLVKAEVLQQDMFSLFLDRGPGNSSSICVGCLDTTKYTGALTYVALDSAAYKNTDPWWWNVESPGISLGGSLMQLDNQQPMSVVVDSGTTLVYVPTGLAKQLYAQIAGASEVPTNVTGGDTGYYWFPCSSLTNLPAVAFRIGGKDLTISAEDFNAGVYPEGSDTCVGAVAGYDITSKYLTKPIAIAGDTFMKSWYTVFDYENKRLGFGAAV